jgi:peptidoglycan hydrolase-like protein with peptidoglycan-binding domain
MKFQAQTYCSASLSFKGRRSHITSSVSILSGILLIVGTAHASPGSFSQNLQLWNTGNDIVRLQQFLNTHGFSVASSGPGSRGEETATFGLHTYQALMAFQHAHGLPDTGFFGPLTREKVALISSSKEN